MVSFRFHIVSLTAVFLALAIGIAVGASVVDRFTLEQVEDTLRTVRARAEATNRENDDLREELGRWNRFGDQGAQELVRGRLRDVPVVVVTVQGVDRGPIDELRTALTAAGARLQGTVRFSSKLQLDNPNDVRGLQELIGTDAARPDALRRTTATRLAEGFAGTGPGVGLLSTLRDAGFVDYEPPGGAPVDVTAVPAPGSYFVVVSTALPDLPNDQVVLPFTTTLARALPSRVLAAEPGRDAQGNDPEVRAIFLRPLREDPDVSGRLSTVDNLEEVRGRIAAVLAVTALADGKTGHFGVGRGTRSLPEPSPT